MTIQGQDVRVQSGVALGMKIGFGIFLFMVLSLVGSCVACVACTGGIAAIGAASDVGVSDDAKLRVAELDLKSLTQGLDLHLLRHGRYPSTSEGLHALFAAGILKGDLKKDPWGNDYVYIYPGKRNPEAFDLFSYGPDGKTDPTRVIIAGE